MTVVIQAGGESRRMGQNKALMTFCGQPLIARVAARLAPLADEMLVTTNSPAELGFLGLPLIPDLLPGKGALGGLYTALNAAHLPLVAVVACDMPFANPRLLAAESGLLRSENVDLVIPRSADGLEPLHAVYRRQPCLEAVRDALENGEMRMVSWIGKMKARVMGLEEIAAVDAELRSFININTPQEFEQAEKWAAQEQSSPTR